MSSDTWSAGERYEPFVGRWSRRVAAEFVRWLDAPPGDRWLDVGCGTGALASTVVAQAEPGRVTGIDPSLGFVAYARSGPAGDRLGVAVGDAMSLPVADGVADHVVAGLVLNFVPEPLRAVGEMRRAAVPGGVVAAYVWDYADRMQLLRYFWDAVGALDPATAGQDEGHRFPLCQPDRLADLFTAAGLSTVVTSAVEVPTVFVDFDDYWTPFLGGQGPAAGYVARQEEAARTALRERLRGALPVAPDGTIALVARAWIVKGTA